MAIIGLVVVSGVVRSSGASTVRDDGTESDDRASESADTGPVVDRTTVPPETVESAATVTAASTSTTAPTTTTTEPPSTAPLLDEEPAVMARPIPVDPPPPPPDAPPAPWADSVVTTAGGHVSTDVGCARDSSPRSLDAFLAQRVGPVIGWDYQHVYPLGGDRHLWLFQDTFIDHSNTAGSLDQANFAHNAALVQDGSCFRLLHSGTTDRPTPFEPGTGTRTLTTWYWPMGGEVHNGRLHVFWARMVKDPVEPQPPDGLGWHPEATFIGTYDPGTLERLDFRPAPQGGASPIYGYTVQSQGEWTYLFGNTFEQNLSREGGWANGPHSGTEMYLARVSRGQLFDQPEFWTDGGWVRDGGDAEPFLERHWAEFPFQPRFMDGQWVAFTAVDGYWGDRFEFDVARNPWGPWTTVEQGPLLPRGADSTMNTYHAHVLPWRDAAGQAVVSVSNNARNMLRDAWPHPSRYRPTVFAFPWSAPPPVPTPTTTTTTTTTAKPPRPSTTTTSSTTTTTVRPSTTTTTSTTATTTSTVPPTASTTTTTVPSPTSTTTTTPDGQP